MAVSVATNSLAVAECGALAVLHPARRGKVGRLGAVEAVVEARVVAVGERYHYVTGLLGDLWEGVQKTAPGSQYGRSNTVFTDQISTAAGLNIYPQYKLVVK